MHPLSIMLSVALFLFLDAVFIYCIFLRWYRASLGPLFREKLTRSALVSAFAFYVLYLGGWWLLVLHPAAGTARTLVNGFTYGCACYGTHALTLHASVSSVPFSHSVVETLYGGCLTLVCTFIALR